MLCLFFVRGAAVAAGLFLCFPALVFVREGSVACLDGCLVAAFIFACRVCSKGSMTSES